MNKIDRPIDLLKEYLNKSVIVRCKDGKVYSGKLIAFDIHINIVLGKTKNFDDNENLGTSFIRGENVNIVFPKEE